VLIVSLCVAPLSWFFLQDYQKQRILVTFDPGLDPQGIGYQSHYFNYSFTVNKKDQD